MIPLIYTIALAYWVMYRDHKHCCRLDELERKVEYLDMREKHCDGVLHTILTNPHKIPSFQSSSRPNPCDSQDPQD